MYSLGTPTGGLCPFGAKYAIHGFSGWIDFCRSIQAIVLSAMSASR